jgi:pectate lyase
MVAADGFGANTTGGAGGTSVTVTNAVDFNTYATSPLPYIITISGTIVLSGNVNITSNKTIEGVDSNATINGDLRIGNGAMNVIIQFLNITNPSKVGDGDGITIINGAKNIFVTHCTFIDCADGMCDITNQSDSVTVSWCRFHYINQTTHRYVTLVGSSDSALDSGYLHVTFHHCWYDQLCNERMPSVRFGRVHVYNNFYSSDSALYCVRTRLYAECLVENNYFEKVKNPWELAVPKAPGTITGKLRAVNNNVSFMDTINGINWLDGWYEDQYIISKLILGTDTVFTPPYYYTLDNAQDVKYSVMNNAGNRGKNGPDGVSKSPIIVARFSLNQNYPNPFNPITTIEFSVGTYGYTSLQVYDLLGREVAILVDEVKTTGLYTVQWDASNFPSGVYFAKLESRTFSKIIKLILTK